MVFGYRQHVALSLATPRPRPPARRDRAHAAPMPSRLAISREARRVAVFDFARMSAGAARAASGSPVIPCRVLTRAAGLHYLRRHECFPGPPSPAIPAAAKLNRLFGLGLLLRPRAADFTPLLLISISRCSGRVATSAARTASLFRRNSCPAIYSTRPCCDCRTAAGPRACGRLAAACRMPPPSAPDFEPNGESENVEAPRDQVPTLFPIPRADGHRPPVAESTHHQAARVDEHRSARWQPRRFRGR